MKNTGAPGEDKLRYWNDFVSKVFHKGMEAYVILRIWNRLNDSRVKFVPQQNVEDGARRRCLVDLFLPQIGLAIEVHEPFHQKTKFKDLRRNKFVEHKLKSKVEVVDCSKSIEDVHVQTDRLVKKIQRLIKQKGSRFIPWQGFDEWKSEYHRQKDVLDIADDDCFKNSDEICRAFGVPIKKRGWQRPGGSGVLRDGQTSLWWPIGANKDWQNVIVGDGDEIHECKRSFSGRRKHVSKVKEGVRKRIVFYHGKDPVFGWVNYRFMGVYHLDELRSLTKCVWVREKSAIKISDYSLNWGS